MIEEHDKVIYSVLADIHQEDGNFTIQDTITYLMEDWHDTILREPEIERAVERCLEAGWIQVLSKQDCEEDRLRWIDVPNQIWSEIPYRMGCVNLTSVGWDVYAKLAKKLGKIPLAEKHRQSVQCIWRTPGWVSILSMSQEELLRELTEIRFGSDALVDGSLNAEHTVGNSIGPYAIGSWWVSRFYFAPYGYRVDVAFEPADMHL